MSIRQQVEDAAFLAQHDRHLGALMILMLAIAASSRRAFPKGTMSLKRSNEKMRDCEAFTQFLGGRIRQLLFGSFGSSEFGTSGVSVNFKGDQLDIADILYKFYRCELVHEGKLPEDIEFSSQQGLDGLTVAQRYSRVSISSGAKMVFDYGWIDLLIQAVTFAPCNGTEFGIEYFNLIPHGSESESAIKEFIVAKYGITLGRFHLLQEIVRLLSPKRVEQSDDAELSRLFLGLLQDGQINRGALTGLAFQNLATQEGLLLSTGLNALREIASRYVLVKC